MRLTRLELVTFGFRKRQNAGDSMSAGTQYPTGNQVDEPKVCVFAD